MSQLARNSSRITPAAPGFEHVLRFWDSALGRTVAKILPGQYYVSCGQELVGTVLGSCVSACVRDRTTCLGAMNHFMLPVVGAGQRRPDVDLPDRYGAFAMEHMLNELFRHGVERRNLEVKIVGGGAVIRSSHRIGERNVDFIRGYLQREGIAIAAEDVGLGCARRVVYDVANGRMLVKHLSTSVIDSVAQVEERFLDEVSTGEQSGGVELF